MFKVSKKQQNSVLNVFKVTRTMLLLLTFNLFCTLFYSSYCWIQTNVCWAWDTVVSDNKVVFSNCEKYIALSRCWPENQNWGRQAPIGKASISMPKCSWGAWGGTLTSLGSPPITLNDILEKFIFHPSIDKIRKTYESDQAIKSFLSNK